MSDNEFPPVETFDPTKDDFEDWVLLFERAVKVTSRNRDDAVLNELYLDWLPLQLNASARQTYKQAKKTTWPELKAELCELFIDPQEEYKWQAKITTIRWDGEENIHSLASRVVQSVNKYNKRMPQDLKEEEYYNRFRSAFKKKIRHIIDMGCPKGSQTIENAKDVVMRNEIVNADRDDAKVKDVVGAASFASGHLHSNQSTNIESALTKISTQLKDLTVALHSLDKRLKKIERWMDDKIRKEKKNKQNTRLEESSDEDSDESGDDEYDDTNTESSSSSN